jgi:antitoxin component of MazEF toxin-antitoxin module
MTEIDVIARKWGDSLAVIIPSDVVKKENIRPHDKIHLSVKKGYDLTPFFGMLKMRKTAQQMKDEERAGWD